VSTVSLRGQDGALLEGQALPNGGLLVERVNGKDAPVPYAMCPVGGAWESTVAVTETPLVVTAYADERVTLLRGHVIAALRSIPAGSVHCVMTSPPYLGLRVYGTVPQVWGGDPECAHAWGGLEPPRRSRWGDLDTLSEKQASNRGSASNVEALTASTGQFCQLCHAWRGELGSEPTVSLFIAHLVEVFREVRRVLRPDGVLWINIADSYCSSPAGNVAPVQDADGAYARKHARMRAATGEDAMRRPVDFGADRIKPKDLCLVPQRLAVAMQEDGWYVRADCLWHKPNPLPESVPDRPMTKDHEYVWMFTPTAQNYWDDVAVREPAAPDSARPSKHRPRGEWKSRKAGQYHECSAEQAAATLHSGSDTRRRRSIWTIPTQAVAGCHFATYPEKLVETPILGSTSAHGVCGLCGAPWERVSEPTPEYAACFGSNTGADAERAEKGYQKRSPAVCASYVTTGWKPSCDCHPAFAGEPVPATVLDIFNGSGTTGVVALRHGRRYIGIDLNADYLELAKQRLGVATP
jgi:DNA modification methylase